MINVEPDNPQYSSIDGVLFNKDKTELIKIPMRKTGTYAVPSSVKNIGFDAFHHCANITSVSIPNHIKVLNESAFRGCTRLNSIHIPNSVKTIGNSAFYYCTELTRIEVSESHPELSSVDGALLSKDKKVLLKVPIGKAGIYTLPATIEYIDGNAFEGCTKLTAIEADERNPFYCSKNGILFNRITHDVVIAPLGKETSKRSILSIER